jgi:hypothetical protein
MTPQIGPFLILGHLVATFGSWKDSNEQSIDITIQVIDVNVLVSLLSDVATLYPIDLGPNKINNTSCNYLGSFFIEKLSLKKHLIKMKTAVHTTDPP